MGLFSKLKEGLTKTRNNIVSGIDSVFSGFSKIDDDFYDELEETLIMGDIGVRATEEIIEDLKEKVKENKKYLSMSAWQGVNILKDILIKGATTVFGIFGIIYISIEGSKNPIQILITLVTLVLFACFGLMSMNSSYCRFYNIQIPYMKLEIKENEIKIKGDNKNGAL